MHINFCVPFFEVKSGRGGGTTNFAQGQFFNDITPNEVLGCINVNAPTIDEA